MKLKKRILAMITMAAVLLGVAAAPAVSSAEEQMTGEAYLNMMAAASAGMTSERISMSAAIKLKSGTMLYEIDAAASTNPYATETTTTMTLIEKKSQDSSSTHSYLVPDAAGTYWEYTDYGEGIGWVKEKYDMTTAELNELTAASTVTEFDTSRLSKIKLQSESTMVNDKECAAVTAQITGKALWKTMVSMDKSLKKEYKFLKKCKPIGITYYIEKATGYPVKMTFSLNAFAKSYLKKDKSMKDLRKEFKSVSLEISYSDINAVSIVLPQEALNAVDIDSLYNSIYY